MLRGAASESKSKGGTESHRLSAHQAAEPLSSSWWAGTKPSLTVFSGRAYSLRTGFGHDTQSLLLLLLVRLYVCFSCGRSVRAKLTCV